MNMQRGGLRHTVLPPQPIFLVKPRILSRQRPVRRPLAVHALVPGGPGPHGKLRFAILGGGVAGVATAYELMRQSNEHVGLGTPVEIALFDAHGIASGGSGAAAGLLHPYSPKGKPLWKGAEAMQAALELIQAAQEVPTGSPNVSRTSNQANGAKAAVSDAEGAASTKEATGLQHELGGYEHTGGASPDAAPFVWQHGVFRCAADDKQVGDMVGAQTTGLQPPLPSSPTDHEQQPPPYLDQMSGLQQQEQQQQQQQEEQQQQQQPLLSQSRPEEQSTRAQQQGGHGLALCPAHLVSGQRLQQLLPGIQVPTLMSPDSQAAVIQERHISSHDSSRDTEEHHNSSHDSTHTSSRDTSTSSAASIPDSSSDPFHPQGLNFKSAAAASAGAMSAGDMAGFFVPQGMVLSVPQYLRQLWAACQAAAAARGDGSSAVLHKQQVSSIAELGETHGPFHAVVVAAGAAVGALADAPLQRLPLCLSQGYTLVMEPRDEGTSYPPVAPSMLGQPYMAAQGERLLIIGATQQFGFTPQASLAMCSPEQHIAYCAPAAPASSAAAPPPPALPKSPAAAAARTLSSHSEQLAQSAPGAGTQESVFSSEGGLEQQTGYCAPAAAAAGTPDSHSKQEAQAVTEAGLEPGLASEDAASVQPQHCAASFQSRWLPGLELESDKGKVVDLAAAAAELLGGAVRMWPPLSSWRIKEIRSGVRAMPPRAAPGSMPLLGRLDLTRGVEANSGTHLHHTAPGSPRSSTGCLSSSKTKVDELLAKTWLFVGLGARGLLYHALFARQLAAAILLDNEQLLGPELRAWSLRPERKQ